MKRFIIRRKEDGKFLKRVATYGNRKSNYWVDSADECTLITTSSAATCIMNNMNKHEDWPQENGRRQRYYSRTWRKDFPFEVIEVGVLIYPSNSQPFMTGVLNGSC